MASHISLAVYLDCSLYIEASIMVYPPAELLQDRFRLSLGEKWMGRGGGAHLSTFQGHRY